MTRLIRILAPMAMLVLLAGCAPEVGSERWCKQMHDTPKSEWSMKDAGAYAENCVFQDHGDDDEEEEPDEE